MPGGSRQEYSSGGWSSLSLREIQDPNANIDTILDRIGAHKPTEVTNPLQRFSLPKFNLKRELQGACGLALVYFGITIAGSYYDPGSRFSGGYASLIYGWQLGTLGIIAGGIIIYDALLRKA